MGSKRKQSIDDTPDHQAKRMKNVLNISADSFETDGEGSDKEHSNLGSWESHVTTQLATRSISVVLRFPNDKRHCLHLNDGCQLKVLFAFIQNHGLDPTSHILRMLYPKRDYNLQMASSTLGSLDFSAQELIHIGRIL